MTDPQIGMLMLGLFIFIIMLGFPIAFTLMAMGVGFGYYAYFIARARSSFPTASSPCWSSAPFEVMSSDVLIAVPLFLFMGYVVERANILDRLFHSLQLSPKNVPGALAVATLATCAMFATATGIVGAVVTLMGLLAFPAMLRAGYDVQAVGRRVCAGGCLGILIPPRIMLIVYARDRRRVGREALRGGIHPGLHAGGLLHHLRDRPRDDQSRRSRRSCRKEQTDVPLGQVLWALADLLLAAGAADRIGAGRDPVRTGDAVGGGGDRLARRASCWRPPIAPHLQRSCRNRCILTARTTAMVCWLFVGS